MIGFGNIARGIVDGLCGACAPEVERLTLLISEGQTAAIDAAFPEAARRQFADISIVERCDALLAAGPDLIVECAGQNAVRDSVPAVLRAGVDVIVVSIGALADPVLYEELRAAATDGGARLILPAGAVGGIDILKALQIGGDVTVRYRGTKPPAAWAGTPAAAQCDLAALSAPTTVFSGDARAAATQFPKNANVAATLALAGAGFTATSVELVADPSAPGNLHEFTIESELATVSVQIANRPSSGNAKTSQTTIYSVLRAIEHQAGIIVI
nr:aspartate dehydrogenase [Pseudohoeflea sp. DP4N28-3]